MLSTSMRETLNGFLKIVKERDFDNQNSQNGIRNDPDPYAWEFLRIRVESEEMRETNEYSCEAGSRTRNAKKNRYRDILPFDSTRVKILTPYADDNDSDYINANFIKGANGNNAYIATQGPMTETLNDFWQMIIENDVKTILMLCDLFEGGKSKCEQYWPELNSSINFNQTIVENKSESKLKDHFTVRELSVSFNGKLRDIRHFHYHGWPDHGTPDEIDPLLEFIDAVHEWQKEDEEEPILVHCSAGCGRSGTFCALDIVRTQLKNISIPFNFSVFELVSNLRKQRSAMVQSKDQYILLYQAIEQMFRHFLETAEIITDEISTIRVNGFHVNGGDTSPRPPARRRLKPQTETTTENDSRPTSEPGTTNASMTSVFTEDSSSQKTSPVTSPKSERKAPEMRKNFSDIGVQSNRLTTNDYPKPPPRLKRNSHIIKQTKKAADDSVLIERNVISSVSSVHHSSLPSVNEQNLLSDGDIKNGPALQPVVKAAVLFNDDSSTPKDSSDTNGNAVVDRTVERL